MGTMVLGMKHGKVYLVKYEGVSHVHNCWIPESEMLLEAPTLVSKFNKKYQKEKVGYAKLIHRHGQSCHSIFF